MHGFTDIIISAERERQVAHSATHMCSRKIPADPSCRLDEVNGIIVMLFYSRGYSQNIGIEDNILRTEAYFPGQNAISPFTNLNLTGKSIRLPFFIKGHHNHGSPVLFHHTGMLDKDFFPFFQGNGINDTLTLHTFQSRKNDIPFRRINHHGYTGNIRFRSNQIQEGGHLGCRIQQAVIHVHINNLRTVFHLLTGNGKRFVIFLLINQPEKFTRTGHIASFAYIHKVYFRRNFKQFQTRQP